MTKRILVLPDMQVTPNTDLSVMDWVGAYIADKQPDIIVNIGDFADMESLSSYDVGKRSYEGRRYIKDVEASLAAMSRLLTPMWQLQDRQRANKKKQYRPRLVITVGNHEERILRATDLDPKLEGLIGLEDLGYEAFGWEVIPFLEVVTIEGVAFSHYFVSGLAGRPASTANAQLNKVHMSCVAGHQQGFQMATGKRADGRLLTSIIAGSCYLDEFAYLGSQGNHHWRGVLMLHDVSDGSFNLEQVPLSYLKERFENG